MASAHRSGNSSLLCAPPGAIETCAPLACFVPKAKDVGSRAGTGRGYGWLRPPPLGQLGPRARARASGLTPAFLSPQAPLHRSRAQLPATMLLLLLGILFLHVAVLVLLFVSTIVSVSAGLAGRAGQGRLPAGGSDPYLGSQPCFPRCQTGVIVADSWASQRPQNFCCCTSLPPASFQFF